MEYSTQRQAGSVVVYTLVGVLLATVAVGAIIVAQNRGSQQDASRPATEAPVSPTAQDKNKTASDTQQAAKDKAAQEKNKAQEQQAAEDKAAREKAQAEAKKQAEETLAAEKQAAEAKAAAEQAAVNAADGPMARTGGAQVQAEALPTTGPVEDLLGVVVGIVAITGAGYFYYHFGRRN